MTLKQIFTGFLFLVVLTARSQEIVTQPKSVQPKEESDTQIYAIVDESPEFPGGMGNMMLYINSNLLIPAVVKTKNISGKCVLKFVVNSMGKIKDTQVLRGVPACPECDQEALRVVKSMPDWTPGKTKGKAVSSYFTLPVMFRAN